MSSFLTTLTIIFVSASVMLYLFQRKEHPAIPAYILAGLVVSFFVPDTDLIQLSELGILFLVFIFGLKFDPSEVRSVGTVVTGVTVLQLLFTGSIGFGFGILLDLSLYESLVLGIGSALSSTLIGLHLSEHEIHRKLLHGRLAEGMHLVQDLIGLLFLGLVFTTSTTDIFLRLGSMVFLIAVALFIRSHIFGRVAESVKYNSELLMLVGLSTLVLAVYTSTILGLPGIIGAFVSGLAAAKFPYNMEILDTFGSLKDFFSAIFFVTLGAFLHVPTAQTISIALGLFFVVSFIKPYIVSEIFKVSGYSDRISILTALSTNHISELTLIIAIQGVINGLLSQPVFDGIIIAAVGSMILSSYGKRYEEAVYTFLQGDWKPETSVMLQDHVVIVGGSVTGGYIASHLSEEDIVVVDNDAEALANFPDRIKTVHGDVLNEAVQDAICLKDAKLIISTALHDVVSKHLVNHEAAVFAYAEDVETAKELYREGATYVILPDIAVADILGQIMLQIDNPRIKETLQALGKEELRIYKEVES